MSCVIGQIDTFFTSYLPTQTCKVTRTKSDGKETRIKA